MSNRFTRAMATRTAVQAEYTSELEAAFAHILRCHPHIPTPVREYRFAPPRRWRFDFAWPIQKIAVELDGGTWSGGRHTRGGGYRKDIEKFNTATIHGWTVLHFTQPDLDDLTCVTFLEHLFKAEQ